MAGEWFVLVEVARGAGGPALDLETVECLLAKLADCYPSALYAPDRCAVQFVLEAIGPDDALSSGLVMWRRAMRDTGLPGWEVVRAEIKTPAELEAEYEGGDPAPTQSVVPVDEDALVAAYDATRRLLHIRQPRDAASVLISLVRRLGGTVLPPRASDPRTMPFDISLGETDPMVPAAELLSIPRLRLEEVLPAVVEDARRMVALLRAPAGGDLLFLESDRR
jgi:hypothetical protein